MGIILKVKSGPQEGREILVRKGSTLLIGRAAERVQFAVPHDMHMSGVHFAVERGPNARPASSTQGYSVPVLPLSSGEIATKWAKLARQSCGTSAFSLSHQ